MFTVLYIISTGQTLAFMLITGQLLKKAENFLVLIVADIWNNKKRFFYYKRSQKSSQVSIQNNTPFASDSF